MADEDTAPATEAFNAWWPTHAVRHNSRSPVAAREAFMAGWDASRTQVPSEVEIAERAEEIHAEHHSGIFVPTLDSCPEHTRAEYEALVTRLMFPGQNTAG